MKKNVELRENSADNERDEFNYYMGTIQLEYGTSLLLENTQLKRHYLGYSHSSETNEHH